MRRASAPRLIDWTGERCVPWSPDIQVIYEHVHRYLWARSLVAGKAVLELGSGEGFGAAILAEAATSVHGIDLDSTTVEHARLRYGTDEVTFAQGDATAIPEELDGAFDVVIAFEVIEHVERQAELLEGARRAMRPGGVLVVSTPNRLLYETTEGGNPFHVHELSDVEFDDLLGGAFSTIATFSQRVAESSRIERRDGSGPERPPVRIERRGDEWEEAAQPAPYYLITVATDGELPADLGDSTLLDHDRVLLKEAERRHGEEARAIVAKLTEAAEREQAELRTEMLERLGALESRRAVEEHRRIVAEASAAQTRRESADLVAVARRQTDAAVALSQREALSLVRAREIQAWAEADRAQVVQATALMRESISWKALQKVRSKWRGDGPRPRLLARATSFALRKAHAGYSARAAARLPRPEAPVEAPVEVPPAPITLTVPGSDQPDVSIVIPVYSGADLTAACLHAIMTSTIDGPAYEVIVVDDCADEETKALLAATDGIRVVVNETNQGFLRSVNAGAAIARASTIVLLNNDTEPQPGWLHALLGRLASSPTVGAVGGRLVYPTGELQEAGGVIFADGTAVNYGNRDQPGLSMYRFARTVDYCSAALLAIRTELWNELGGFDELFSPGYYEDVDLCFRLRDLGFELWYEPQAIVVHKEGGSHGTDLEQGVKRYQVLNREHFHARWQQELADRAPTATVVDGKRHADRRPGPVVVIVDHIVPEPDRDAGSLRMMHLINALLEQGARVVFVPMNRWATPGYAAALETIGVEIVDGDTPLVARFSELEADCRLVIVSRPGIAASMLPDLRVAFPEATVVYDTVDLHWLRETGRSEFEPVPDSTITAYREIEGALIRSADVTAVVTQEEREAVLEVVPDATLAYLPVVHALPEPGPGRAGRTGVLFVGGFRHHPNVDAAVVLGDEIMPLLRARGSEQIATVVGPDVPPAVAALAAEDFLVPGWVERLDDLLDGSIAMVAPLRYGAGMKGKVGQALAHGLPVITTAVGAQGFGLVDGQDALLAETPEEFADAIDRLAGDPELWARLAANGRSVIERTCSIAIMGDSVRELLELAQRGQVAAR